MKKIVKLFALVALTVATVFGLSSCGGTDRSHTIVFYHTMGQNLQDVLEKQIAVFEAKYPGWYVEHSQGSGYDGVRDKVIGDLAAKNQPDVAYCYADHVALYMQSGAVTDMSKYINSTDVLTTEDGVEHKIGYTAAEISDFVTGYWAEGKGSNFEAYADYGFTADSMLMVPFAGKSTELMYYNKTALDKLNLKPAKTWEDLWEQCEIIKDEWPTCTPLGYDSDANWLITTCVDNNWGYTSAQAPHYLFNNDGVKGWLNEIYGYYKKGYVTTESTYGTYTSGLFTLGVENEAGGCVYCIGSSGGASHQNPGDLFEWGIAPVPGNHAISQGPSLVMLNNKDNENWEEKELMTWLFIKEILEPTFQASFSYASGYAPSRKSTYKVPSYADEIADKTNITMVAASVCRELSYRDGYLFTSPAFVGSSTARDNAGTIVEYVLTGQKSPEKALADGIKYCGGN